EIATRLALGASRRRLLQQLLCESLLLTFAGTLLGIGMSQAAALLLARIQLPLPVPVHLQVGLDWRLIIYSTFLTGLTTVACGLFPAVESLRESVVAGLQRGRRLHLSRSLVVVQITLSLVVLFVGFLFLRNLFAATALSPGFDIRNTLRAAVYLP